MQRDWGGSASQESRTLSGFLELVNKGTFQGEKRIRRIVFVPVLKTQNGEVRAGT